LCRPARGTGGAGVGAFACLRTSPSDGILLLVACSPHNCCWAALDDTGSANRSCNATNWQRFATLETSFGRLHRVSRAPGRVLRFGLLVSGSEQSRPGQRPSADRFPRARTVVGARPRQRLLRPLRSPRSRSEAARASANTRLLAGSPKLRSTGNSPARPTKQARSNGRR
jgi:hypothetical protein